ncbi:gas vesicle protein GvpG [Candidatus Oscillochloris fontis]|uniref:gas vesicle protein GvpG n=1 Tax=Candidatus Oscillochloris fontis TaxID=2496868 RepID=UPI00101D4C3C|nr:gas vesicle protein GvpG [Candidatus Oscillochloris fontis]
MGLLSILTFPITAPLEGVLWVAEQITEQAEDELYNPQRIRQKLADFELRLDMGEITEEQYLAVEEELLARLRVARERQRQS